MYVEGFENYAEKLKPRRINKNSTIFLLCTNLWNSSRMSEENVSDSPVAVESPLLKQDSSPKPAEIVKSK